MYGGDFSATPGGDLRFTKKLFVETMDGVGRDLNPLGISRREGVELLPLAVVIIALQDPLGMTGAVDLHHVETETIILITLQLQPHLLSDVQQKIPTLFPFRINFDRHANKPGRGMEDTLFVIEMLERLIFHKERPLRRLRRRMKQDK